MIEGKDYEVSFGYNAVWVNAPTGECVGRFGKLGIDVHRSMQEQMDGKGQCLACTHARVTIEDWRRFVALMKEHSNVELAHFGPPPWV
jgi:hypothetical protein